MRIIVGVLAAGALVYVGIVGIGLLCFGVAWLVQRWRAVSVVPRRGIAPGASALATLNAQCDALAQRDEGDEDPEKDIATEGLGTDRPVPLWHWGRRSDGRPFVRRAWPSWTTPLAYLPETEWQLWTSVIAESAR